MLGISGMLVNSGDGGAAATATEARESGGGSGVGPSSGGFNEEESDRNSGGNRWPRQETVALLQVRSDMDVAFRDSSLKGPLWEEVSRKLGEMGYHRNAKKCKEKFENVYKYHRRTKEGRSTKPEGKSYRFFEQLEALENQTPPGLPRPFPPQQQQLHHARPQSQPFTSATPVAVAMPEIHHPQISTPQFIAVSSVQNLNTSTNPPPPNQLQLSSLPPPLMTTPMNFSYQPEIPSSHREIPADMASFSTSSSTSSDEEREKRGKRKRKWGHFFQRLMSEVIEKQEEMQRKFLDTLERRECERVAREEAWRAQEMARMNREHELSVHERSVAAAKDAAVIQFLQKISDQQYPNVFPMQMHQNDPTPPPVPPPPTKQTPPPCQPVQHPQTLLQPLPLPPPPPPQPEQSPKVRTPTKALEIPKFDNEGVENFNPATSSRWPKPEIEALIKIRTNMDTKYQENVPKGPLWEEISAAMRKIGYDRNPKRCKEKWENINKYFKKVKESNKKRPNDSKTCPYFQQLDVLYKEKTKNENINTSFNPNVFGVNLENVRTAHIMVQPERQYQSDTAMEDDDSQNMEDEEGEDEDYDEIGVYEVVSNKESNPMGQKME